MTTAPLQTIKQSLQDMIQYCKGIQNLLTSDVDHLSKNAISDIQASNNKKEILIENLNQLTNKLATLAPTAATDNPLDKVLELAKTFDNASRKDIQELIATLKSEIAKAYESLAINSTILTSHIHSTKTLWDNLLSCQPSASCVYDSKGNTHK